MADAMTRKVGADRESEKDIARDDPLFELSQIIGFDPQADAKQEAEAELEDTLASQLEGDLVSYDNPEPAANAAPEPQSEPAPAPVVLVHEAADDVVIDDAVVDDVVETVPESVIEPELEAAEMPAEAEPIEAAEEIEAVEDVVEGVPLEEAAEETPQDMLQDDAGEVVPEIEPEMEFELDADLIEAVETAIEEYGIEEDEVVEDSEPAAEYEADDVAAPEEPVAEAVAEAPEEPQEIEPPVQDELAPQVQPAQQGGAAFLEQELLQMLGGIGEKTQFAEQWSGEDEQAVVEETPVEPVNEPEGFAQSSVARAEGHWIPDEYAVAGESPDMAAEIDPQMMSDAAILDQFESALFNDMSISIEESDIEDDEPEADANPHAEISTFEKQVIAARREVAVPNLVDDFGWADQEEELIEALASTFDQPEQIPDAEVPVLDTAELPAGDIEQMQPLDLPELPAAAEIPPEDLNLEREIDAAIAGIGQFDDDAWTEDDPEEPVQGADHADFEAVQDTDGVDIDDLESDLARDLEFVEHDLTSEVAAVPEGFDEYEQTGEAEAQQSGGSRRGLMIAAVIGGIAVIGAIGAFSFMSDGGDNAAPVLIKADQQPIKIEPEDPGGQSVPNQDRAVYNEADGGSTRVPTQEKLVSTSEEPVDLAAGETLLPSGVAEATKAEDRLAPQDDVDPAAQAPNGSSPILAPRRVRTVIVKPDGTFVAQPVEQQPVAVVRQPLESPVSETAGNDAGQTARPVASDAGTATPAEQPREVAIVVPPAADPQPEVAPTAESRLDALRVAAERLSIAAETPTPGTRQAVGPVRTASTETQTASTQPTVQEQPQAARPRIQPPSAIPDRPSGQTTSTVPAQTASAPQPAPSATSDYTVQIASLPNEDLARSTAANLSQRYSELIGGRSITIQQADIEGRGTFHRVRVATSGRDDAVALCERYKQAGGSCFVAR